MSTGDSHLLYSAFLRNLMTLDKFAAGWSKIGGYAAGFLLVYITVHTVLEIILREIFGISTKVHVEFVGYALASMTFLSLGQTMREGALVRVNVIFSFLPQPIRRFLDVFCVISTAAVIAFAIWFMWFDMARAYKRGYETDGIIPLPLWIPLVPLLVGLVIFQIELIVQALLIVFSKRSLPESTVSSD